MKKFIKIFLFLYLLVMIPTIDVKAKMYAIDSSNEEYESVPSFYFLLGTHMYSSLLKIDYLEIIKAADSAGDYEPILYQKVYDNWYSFDGQKAEVPNKDGLICISHIDGVELDDSDCTVKSYTVKFENDEPSINKEVSINEGNKILAADVPTNTLKNGYKFICWVDENAEDTDNPLDSCYDFSKPITGDLTLIPYYEVITYTVNFVLNGIEDETITSQSCNLEGLVNNGCKLPNVNTSRPGYKFLGWSTSNDDSNNGAYYKADSSMIDLLGEDNTITLYAVWQPEEYTITYNLDGGTFGENVVVKSTFTDLTKDNIKLFVPTKIGYTFKGWKLSEEDSGSISGPSSELGGDYVLTLTKLQNVTLTAEWTEKEYTITYSLGVSETGDEFKAPDSITCKFNTSCKLADAPKREGYVFAGWTDSNGYLYAANKEFKGIDFASSEITLTAVWYSVSEKPYTVTYNLNGGAFDSSPLSVFGEAQKEETLPTPKRLGYEFDGWCKDNGQEQCENITKVSDVLGEEEISNITLYAKWKANTYTIIFHEDASGVMGAAEGLQSVTCTYDQECELKDHSSFFSSKEKTLKGWSYTYGEEAKVYFSDNIKVKNLTATKNGTIDLYAVTDETLASKVSNEYQNMQPEFHLVNNVYYFLDEGKFVDDKMIRNQAIVGEKITLPVAYKEGYTFDGWYRLNSDGNANIKVGNGNELLTILENTVLVAKYIEN